MNTIFLLMLIFALSVFLIMIASIWFMNFFSRKYIGEKHMVLEELTKGEVPKLWSERFKQKCKKLQKRGQHEKMAKLKQDANETYMKKLNKIVNYIQKTKLVENEETRSMILSDLQKTRNKWEAGKENGI
ncbi:hypothetical protein WQ54_22080 [Bacillus sp. SA1-12]|uniref:hypothetical protein n=1 Tax=Bacillus sp. SA1-12 TaxID=1455638 RepID=UPI000627234C|nr:hypothetical protein [Bacillus sp. SA1-12]KKI89843.1 hypothetical protein WQ54_22080 [Bacillus sp. SA1-12]